MSTQRKPHFEQIGESSNYTLTLSNSSLGQFAFCPRAGFYYILEQRKKRKDPAAINAGSAFHLAQEIASRVKDPEQRHTLQVQAIEQFYLDHPVDDSEWRNAERVLEATRRYTKFYKDRKLEVLYDSNNEPFVDVEFVLPLGTIRVDHEVQIDPKHTTYIATLYIQWKGIIDDIITLDYQNFIRDFKTTTRGGPTFFDQFWLSQQTIGYVWAARQLSSVPIHGAIIDQTVWRRPSPTGKPFDFDWQRFYYTDEQCEEWQENTLETVATFIAYLKSQVFPMSGTFSGCHTRYGKCQYLDVCSLPQANRAEVLASNEYQSTRDEDNGELE